MSSLQVLIVAIALLGNMQVSVKGDDTTTPTTPTTPTTTSPTLTTPTTTTPLSTSTTSSS